MTRVGRCKWTYHRTLLVTVLELPYSRDRFSLYILLPDKGPSSPWTLTRTRIRLEIAKFSLDIDEDMIERMKELGIQHLFDAKRINLRHMTSNPNAGVSQMKHRAVIAVDEGGTTASAATSVKIMLKSSPLQVKVNRPFLFVLRDKTAHMNFFMGRYVNPQGHNVLK
ncbi:glia-derived nexin-like protein [Plakobranchus ocellatus]|uniref:Glia-derived nexin-like protein n=1 Tax=Plakobranchus ocellatus TaxID=259542 RepID=A0AAV4DY73_9GAST|nr:glia-derived nexin-like protein [Plakobranchus ocellatus]